VNVLKLIWTPAWRGWLGGMAERIGEPHVNSAVGKTFEMLTQGRRRRLEGTDVVIGVVETHGRQETEALTKGFEIIPKKRGLYKGRVVAEMDLDAILQRKPNWCWWTNWLTPTWKAAGIPSAI
jgi:hypothetical protein